MATTFLQVLLFACAGGICHNVLGESAVENALKQNEVIPDVISEAPSNRVKVTYGAQSVNLGNVLTPTQTKNVPEVSYPSQPQSFYTLIMVDPDATSRENPIYREFLHWLVGNIPGDQVEKGETIAEYIPPAPPKQSGLHRYVFVVYKQPDGKINFTEEHLSAHSQAHRANFHVRDFAKKYNLGEPIAANFLQAMYDSYVPVVLAQVSGN